MSLRERYQAEREDIIGRSGGVSSGDKYLMKHALEIVLIDELDRNFQGYSKEVSHIESEFDAGHIGESEVMCELGFHDEDDVIFLHEMGLTIKDIFRRYEDYCDDEYTALLNRQERIFANMKPFYEGKWVR